MKFTPKYTVSYKGMFHKAGVPFEIDGKDANVMAPHGMVEMPEKPIKKTVEQTDITENKADKKPGRPRKVSA